MKRVGSLVLAAAIVLVVFTASQAVDITDYAKVPASYGTVVDKDGKKSVVFAPGPMGYGPADYDRILSAYGLTITDYATVPASYGTSWGNEPIMERTIRSVTGRQWKVIGTG